MNFESLVSSFNPEEFKSLISAANKRQRHEDREAAKGLQLTLDEADMVRSGRRLDAIKAVYYRTKTTLTIAKAAVDIYSEKW